ncbi:MAG: hypothetical protein WA633_26440, partial [Stellaceae bacterium]
MNKILLWESFRSAEDIQDRRLTWLWLVIGCLLLPFTMAQTMLPLAAWLAPIFLLRFARTFRRPTVALLLIWFAQTVGKMIALRGGWAPILWVVETLTLFCVVRGLESTLPYVVDRLLCSRLDDKARTFVFPLALVTAEWLSTLGRELNAGGLAVYSQDDSLSLLQIFSITGMWGVIFLMGWAASTANAVWERGFAW